MYTFILALAVLLLAVSGLAIGVLFGRAPIKGSCGGLACHPGIDCKSCRLRNEGKT
ncbi:(Na+)-NQR maturation NqrM [Pontivivens nitratireducens]|uniref:(Na+)-NQR maturation NqrM n=1 Tax=Pontivivens nitratireducens TaxID=2758038 RepID=UPI00163A2573|nr:(Na+)-NQR maturation NqrM [Pontibrevibacter nitratireducens]